MVTLTGWKTAFFGILPKLKLPLRKFSYLTPKKTICFFVDILFFEAVLISSTVFENFSDDFRLVNEKHGRVFGKRAKTVFFLRSPADSCTKSTGAFSVSARKSKLDSNNSVFKGLSTVLISLYWSGIDFELDMRSPEHILKTTRCCYDNHNKTRAWCEVMSIAYKNKPDNIRIIRK